MKALVIVVDGLSPAYLGPNGNTWVETPASCRLAADCVLWERAIADSTDLATVYRSYWCGMHAAQPAGPTLPSTLMRRLVERHVLTRLLTDDEVVAGHELAREFTERTVLAGDEALHAAESIAETHFASAFAAITELLERGPDPSLLWVHLRGLFGPWDAPYELRAGIADDDDPEPPRFVSPPQEKLPKDVDPDYLLGISQAYAAQVMAFDQCLDALLNVFEQRDDGSDTLLALTAPRGYPLGRHGRVGLADHALYGELVHVPLMIRWPGYQYQSRRCQHLAQPPDLCATLSDYFELEPASCWGRSWRPFWDDIRYAPHDRALVVAADQAALEVPGWYLRRADGNCELFVKPDDRWEANELASRCPEVVESLNQLLDAGL